MPHILLQPGLSVDPLLLVFIGFAVGTVGSFIGVGGGYMVTPALIVLGFPANLAVGTDITHIVGKALVATLRHRRLGNVDFRLGLFMAVGGTAGVEVGVRIVNALKQRGDFDVIVLSCSLVVMIGISALTSWEAKRARALLADCPDGDACPLPFAKRLQALKLPPVIHFPKSGLSMSLWVVIASGVAGGAMAGFFGVGGGFIRVPSLVYLIGQPTILAVGTDLFEIIVSAGYGCARHAASGNVVLPAALVMLLGASVGAQIGAAATAYVNGPAVRRVLSWSVSIAAVGSALRLTYLVTGKTLSAVDFAAKAFTIGEMVLLVAVVVGLHVCGVRASRGKPIPRVAVPFLLVRPADATRKA